jgi:hypothetical protein
MMLIVFALTLFSSATLLFLVQPMVGKLILPLQGGTPAVWNTCMVFFQAALLAGYGYAHATTAWLGARKQSLLHLVVLVVPLLGFLPISINTSLIHGGEQSPVLSLLLVLFFSVGLPFFVISTSAPLLQKWFASTDHPSAADPYFLYGASNLGSMLALLGYPAFVEPNWALYDQRVYWAIGYGVLAAGTLGCIALLWLSRPAPQPAAVGASAAEAGLAAGAVTPVGTSAAPVSEPVGVASQAVTTHTREAVTRGKKKGKNKGKPRTQNQVTATPTPLASSTSRELLPAQASPLGGEVTWRRRLRWVALALVPSSMMLGVTTYITTDLAPIPLLWVLPLAIYLLSFIIVFAKIPHLTQRIIVWLGAVALAVAVGYFVVPGMRQYVAERVRFGEVIGYLLWLVPPAAVAASLLIFRLRMPHLLHLVFVLALPLLVLFVVFMMLSERKLSIPLTIALHLLTLFVVAMVCHGEMARDRPSTKHLTEFFLWMSVGGVLGGLFNALVAPLVFNGLVEYQLIMVVACLLLPPLGSPNDSAWGPTIDVALAVLFLLTGAVLIGVRMHNNIVVEGVEQFRVPLEHATHGPWGWLLAAVLLVVAVGAVRVVRQRQARLVHAMDYVLPLTLCVLVVGLSWGLESSHLYFRLRTLGDQLKLERGQLYKLLTFGVPAVLCYTFVDRSIRFGLGVGALLLGAAFCGLFDTNTLMQKRSFFGVLKVEEDELYHRLVHGTTLHGKQFRDPARHREPLTYYHRTGPMGHLFDAYWDKDPRKNYAVVGLGTGTMACYAEPGQHLTFYDIDTVVRDIAYNTDYFTYVSDAEERGVNVELVLGDARLTMERKQLSEDEKYNILCVDAFSSDAIPIHLITRQALQMYLTKIKEDGIIAFHVSNRYLDLRPVLARLAEVEGLTGYYESDGSEGEEGKAASTWVVLARKPEYLSRLPNEDRWERVRLPVQQAMVSLLAVPDNGTGLKAQAFILAGLTGDDGDLDLERRWTMIRMPWRPLKTWDDVGEWTDDYSNLLSVFTAWK